MCENKYVKQRETESLCSGEMRTNRTESLSDKFSSLHALITLGEWHNNYRNAKTMSDSRCSKLILARVARFTCQIFHIRVNFFDGGKFLLERRIDGEHRRRLNGIVSLSFCVSRHNINKSEPSSKPPQAPVSNKQLFPFFLSSLKRWILMMVTLNEVMCDWVCSRSDEQSVVVVALFREPSSMQMCNRLSLSHTRRVNLLSLKRSSSGANAARANRREVSKKCD